MKSVSMYYIINDKSVKNSYKIYKYVVKLFY